MKEYKHVSDDGFVVSVLWHHDWRYLRMESGGTDNPQEMIVTYQGLTPFGAVGVIRHHMQEMVGVPGLVPDMLTALAL
jgi:hypothetical protein